jgi:MFS family permease
MTRILSPILALLISTSLLLMGNGLQGTLLPVRGQIEGFSPFAIGIMGSAYFLGFGVGCIGGPPLIERSGHVRAFAAVVAIASVVVLAHAIVLDPWTWSLMRSVTGACFAVLYMIIESWLNEMSSNEDRGLVFSVYTIIQLTVMTVGQLMMMLDEPTDFPLFSVASGLISLSAVPLALTRASVPGPIEAVTIDFSGLYRTAPIGLVGCLVVGLTNGAFWSLAPLFVQESGGDTQRVALFMSTAIVGGAIGQWPIGRFSDRVDRRFVIQLSSVGAAIAGVFAAWATTVSADLILLGGFAYGIFAFPLYTVCVAHTNDFVAPDGYVQAASGLLLVYAVGAVLGPLVASALMSNSGYQMLFLYTASIQLVMPMRRRPPEEERIAFSDALVISATTSNVDPLPEDSEHESLEPAGD